MTFLGYFIFNFSFGQNIEKADVHLDKQLVAILDTILVDDQKYRGDENYKQQLDNLAKKYGWESKEVKDQIKYWK
ncbi:MAG: hypothetical protein HC831_30975, partial [Chloroflexia bacterium]|nr:hypothetical protein [Chloroflexia bacterium]